MKLENLAAVAILVAGLTVPLAAEAQQSGKLPLVGWLLEAHAPSGQSENFEAFRHALRSLGYVEGQNISIVYRFGEGKDDRLPALANELVRLNPDVIVADVINLKTAKALGITISPSLLLRADHVIECASNMASTEFQEPR